MDQETARKAKINSLVKPLVGTVKMEGFDSSKFGHIISLQTKLLKHINAGNQEKIKMYLAFCIQEWPHQKDCPIDPQIIREAIDAL